MHLRRQNIEANSSFNGDPSLLTIINENKWGGKLVPWIHRTSRLKCKIYSFFRNFLLIRNCFPFQTYLHFLLHFAYRPVHLLDTLHFTIFHTSPSLYSLFSQFTTCFLFCGSFSRCAFGYSKLPSGSIFVQFHSSNIQKCSGQCTLPSLLSPKLTTRRHLASFTPSNPTFA